MARPRLCPDELRERAVRLLMEWHEARRERGRLYTVAAQLETLRR